MTEPGHRYQWWILRPWCWLVGHIGFPCPQHHQVECLRCGATA